MSQPSDITGKYATIFGDSRQRATSSGIPNISLDYPATNQTNQYATPASYTTSSLPGYSSYSYSSSSQPAGGTSYMPVSSYPIPSGASYPLTGTYTPSYSIPQQRMEAPIGATYGYQYTATPTTNANIQKSAVPRMDLFKPYEPRSEPPETRYKDISMTPPSTTGYTSGTYTSSGYTVPATESYTPQSQPITYSSNYNVPPTQGAGNYTTPLTSYTPYVMPSSNLTPVNQPQSYTSPNFGPYSSYGGYSTMSTTPYSELTKFSQTIQSTGAPTQDIDKQTAKGGGISYLSSSQPGIYSQASAPTNINMDQGAFLQPLSRGIETISKGNVMNISKVYDPKNPENPYNKLMARLTRTGEKFKDPEFPPSLLSLTGGMTEQQLLDLHGDYGFEWKSLIWLRPDEFFRTNNYQIFTGGIHPNDIKQGILGDCYFLSTLASLAEWPSRIERLFASKEINNHGCYAVKLCDMGEWKEVIIDDHFPCFPDDKTLAFSRSVENELWVLLLEKAWSKLYGAYANIETGLTREALHDLTGAPTKFYITEGVTPTEKEIIWTDIETGEKMNFVMTCGAADFFGGLDQLTEVGLVASHAYSLLAAMETETPKGRVRLVKLRNPWGRTEWQGDWGDKSNLWTPELKEKLKVEDNDEGIFYMNYDTDFLKYFSDIQICKYYDDYVYSNLKVKCNHKNASFFRLHIEKDGQYYITVNQMSKRHQSHINDFKYSAVWLVLGKIEGDKVSHIEGVFKADREAWTESHLKAGEYIISVKIQWQDKQEHEFTISGYGPGEVRIEQTTKTQVPRFIEKAFIDKGRQSKKIENYSDLRQPNCRRAVELTEEGYGFLYYQNNGNRTLNEVIDFKLLEGLKLCKPYRGRGFQIKVAPGEEKVVILKIDPEAETIRQSFTETSKFE